MKLGFVPRSAILKTLKPLSVLYDVVQYQGWSDGLKQGQQTYFVKGQVVNIFSFRAI